ncbi:MAG: DUF6568 family protein [Bacilli bacterium]
MHLTKVVKNERYIPIKNYVIAVLVVISVVLLTLYFMQWYKVLEENKLSSSFLIKSNTITNEVKELEEIEAVFSEVPEDYFVYVSYTGSEKVYNMEKELEEVIDDYNLNNKFYFINVTNVMDDDDYVDKINEALGLEEQKINKVPTIIYYKDGKIASDGILTREDDNIITAADFLQFLEEKEYEK